MPGIWVNETNTCPLDSDCGGREKEERGERRRGGREGRGRGEAQIKGNVAGLVRTKQKDL